MDKKGIGQRVVKELKEQKKQIHENRRELQKAQVVPFLRNQRLHCLELIIKYVLVTDVEDLLKDIKVGHASFV